MRLSPTVPIIAFSVAVLLSQPAMAIDFPFDAIVVADEALVRSGTGGDETDYSTMKLRRGDKVRVLHQEFGGWYKIAPPDGSFSWIREDYVDRTGDQGVVRQDTMDIIGSEIGTPKFEVRNLLRQGEVVQILSRAENLDRGPRTTPMLRIRPPRGEFRFLRQRDLVPADEYVAQPEPASAGTSPSRPSSKTVPADEARRGEISPFSEPARDPFAKNETAKIESLPNPATATERPAPGELPGGATFELARTVPREQPGTGSSNRLPESAADGISMKEFGFQAPGPADPTWAQLTDAEKKQVEAAWEQLKQLDLQFRAMKQKPVAEWKIAELKQSYESLRKKPDGYIRRQIERRLAGLQRYEELYREIAEVQEILRRTEERDEQIRQSYQSGRRTVAMREPTRTVVRPAPSAPQPRVAASPRSAQARPQPAGQTPIVRQPARPQPRFDGAGIIQRAASARGGARHVLLALDGRVLAYLQGAPGVNLDRFLGQSMGLLGPRQFRRDLNTDFMVVRQLTPVRLRP